jgi:hypothetical protein
MDAAAEAPFNGDHRGRRQSASFHSSGIDQHGRLQRKRAGHAKLHAVMKIPRQHPGFLDDPACEPRCREQEKGKRKNAMLSPI